MILFSEIKPTYSIWSNLKSENHFCLGVPVPKIIYSKYNSTEGLTQITLQLGFKKALIYLTKIHINSQPNIKNIMKLLLISILLLISQHACAAGLDEKIDNIFAPILDKISAIIFYPIPIFGGEIPLSVLWLVIGAVAFTFMTRFIGIWGLGHSFSVLKNQKDEETGEISSFQALTTALSGTIGLGNIAGIAIGITLGGPGAVFWMWIGALFGMALMFVECTLGVKYRKVNPDGTVSGGPMYYISRGLTRKGMRKLGIFLAGVFAIGCMGEAISCGSMFVVKQISSQIILMSGGETSMFYNNKWVIGVVIALIAGTVIWGGIKSISKTASRVVPFMCVMYFLLAMIVIFANIDKVPSVFGLIFQEAFNPRAVEGGFAAVIIMGLRRSVSSNEAGVGSAAIAYSSVKTREPISQGFVSILGPFIDTIIFCSLTAFVILITDVYKIKDAIGGVELSSQAFETVIPFAPWFLTVVIILFAMSTLIAWAYYGQKSWNFFFGEHIAVTRTYQILFLLCIVAGSAMNLRTIIDLADSMMFAMAVPNLIALYILFPDVKQDLAEYCQKYKVGFMPKQGWFSDLRKPDMLED